MVIEKISYAASDILEKIDWIYRFRAVGENQVIYFQLICVAASIIRIIRRL